MRPGIIDLEASGFGAMSYPIEVGVALPGGRKVCSLIAPAGDWLHWDEKAELLHGISRAMLASHGRAPRVVAEDLNELLGHGIFYSDGWVVDSPWLSRLFFSAGMAMEFSLSPLELILDELQMVSWHATKTAVLAEHQDRRHRASFDAFVMQETYWRTRRSIAAPL